LKGERITLCEARGKQDGKIFQPSGDKNGALRMELGKKNGKQREERGGDRHLFVPRVCRPFKG